MREIHPSLCRLCTAHCPILVTLEDGRAVEVRGDPEAPLFGGYSCPKGRALPEQHASPERLLRSQKRRPEGGFDPIPVERAIGEIAERLRAIVARHGPRAVALYIGTHSLTHPASGGMATAFLRALGSRMIFSAATIDQPGQQIAAALHGQWRGGAQAFDSADAWLFVGTNPVISKAGGLGQNPARALARARRRGTQLIAIDPRRSETARLATLHLQPRPGEDPTLLAGLIQLCFAEGWIDADFVRENARGAEQLERAVARFTPDHVARRAEVPQEALVRAARLLGNARRGGIVGGTGPSFATRGNLAFYLMLCLQTLRGFWARAGDPLQKPNALLPAWSARAQPWPPYRATGGGEALRARGLASSVAGLPTAALAEEILEPGPGRVRALFCLGSSPMLAWPDQQRSRRAMGALELLVTTDVELSATARLAHYAIATKLSLETPGFTQQAEALKYFTPGLGFDAPHAQYSPALALPPRDSELIEDWQLYYRLAQRMGLSLDWINFFGIGQHQESPLQLHPLDMQREPTTDELYELMCHGSRIPLAEVKRHPHGRVFEDASLRVAARDPDCALRLELAEPRMLSELAELAAEDFAARRAAEKLQHPFLLIPRRANKLINSTGRSWPGLMGRRRYNPAHLHPQDLAALGVTRGALVEIRSAHGAITGVAEADPTLRRGLVSMTHGFGRNPGEREDPRRDGANTNRLLRADLEFDPISGIPRMGAVPVSVRSVSPTAAD